MPITVQTPAHSTNLTLLATVKTELLITGSSHDAFLESLIAQASDAVRGMIGARIERMEVTETLKAAGDYLLPVSIAPVAKVVSASLDGADQTLEGISIYQERAGLLYREAGWTSTTPSARPWAGALLWSLRYWGGWLLPGDDVSASTISVDATDDSYNDSAGGFPAVLVAGDLIRGSGFAEAGNNGTKRVVSATASKIVVDTALTTEAAGAVVSVILTTLPYDIERACIDIIKVGYSARDRDPSIASKEIGDVRVSYFDGASRDTTAPWKLLAPYIRHVV